MARQTSPRLGIAAQIDLWVRAVINRRRLGDVRQMIGAPYTAEVHERIVRLSISLEPMIPIITPLTTIPQLLRQPCATRLVVATTIVVVAIKVFAGVRTAELCRTSFREDALPSS